MKMLTFLVLNLQDNAGRQQYGSINIYDMKKGMLFILLVSSVIANAQTLKDALFSGKLKSDTGTVIRKGDDLSTKIDTSRKKTVEPEKAKMVVTAAKDSSVKGSTAQIDSVKISGVVKADTVVAVKDNNTIWKEYTDSVISTVKTEVLPSKKIKNDTYFVSVEYEIDTVGQVSINTVSSSPENSFLQQQVKERLDLTPPRMNPIIFNGKAKKVTRRYNFTLSKM
jgi:hypothetical protein